MAASYGTTLLPTASLRETLAIVIRILGPTLANGVIIRRPKIVALAEWLDLEAGVMATVPTTRDTAPSHQVPQWLFAFDPAGMTTFRTLALLVSHPEHAERVRREIRDQTKGSGKSELPYLRASCC